MEDSWREVVPGPSAMPQSGTDYDEMLDYFYRNMWPALSKCCEESITRFTGERRIGLWGSFGREEGDESTIKFLAEEIASKKQYSVFTGKGIFKVVGNTVVLFPLLIHLAPTVMGVEKFCQWLVRLVPKSIVLLGKSKSTATTEESESLESGKPTLGLAIIKFSLNGSDKCQFFEEYAIFGRCKGTVAACPKARDKYCPFFKVGTPYGRLDLYTRKRNGMLLAVEQKENAFDALTHVGFI